MWSRETPTFTGAVVAEDDPFPVPILGQQQVQQEQVVKAPMMALVPPGELLRHPFHLKHKDKHIIFKYSHGHTETCFCPWVSAVPSELRRNTESLLSHSLLLMLTKATPLGQRGNTIFTHIIPLFFQRCLTTAGSEIEGNAPVNTEHPLCSSSSREPREKGR